MQSKWHVSEFMTRAPFVCREDTPLNELTRTLVERQITSAPVVDSKENLAGIISLVDIAADAHLVAPQATDRKVRDAMQKRVYAVNPGDTLVTVVTKFKKHKVHHLVVTHNDRVVGIVSVLDLLDNLMDYTGYPAML